MGIVSLTTNWRNKDYNDCHAGSILNEAKIIKRYFKRTRRVLVEFVLLTLVLLATSIFLATEPLGDAAERYLYRMASPYIGNLYHEGYFSVPRSHNPESREQAVPSKLLAVVIDDETLVREQRSYPLLYWQYAEHLERIGRQRPKAIFVDMWLHDQRENDDSMDELVRVICRLSNPPESMNQKPVAVFLLSLRAHGLGLHPALNAVSDRGAQPGTKPCFFEVDASVPGDHPEQKGWYYPFKVCNYENCLPSAAVAIYNRVLTTTPKQQIHAAREGNFQLLWTNQAPHIQAEADLKQALYGHVPAFLEECTPSKKTLYFAKYFLLSSVVEDPPVCSSFLQLTTYDLELATSQRHRAGKGLYVSNHMNDAVVVYGYRLAGLNDYVNSPVHGLTLGLEYHLMAINNLDRLGNDVIQENQYVDFLSSLRTRELWFTVFLCAIGSIIAICIRKIRALRKRATKANHHCAFRFISGLIGIVAVPILFLILTAVLIHLNSIAYLRYDFTMVVETVFFVIAIGALSYTHSFVDYLMKAVFKQR